MFEQDCGTNERRNRGLFREEDGPFAGFGRFQVSGENDPAEVRADSMADSVVGGGLFRSPEGGGGGGFQADLPLSDLAGGGESLPAGLQGSMEQSFGADFSGVRVHTGAGADRASRDISARAFTRGQDVYFRDGAYDPGSQEGRHLIAHELAHVAAGDGGIHRDPENERSTSSAPATGERSANELRKAARAKFTYVQEDEKKAKRLIAQCSDNLLGNLTTMAGSIAKMAGNSLIGSIISMVGTAIGLVGGIRDAFKSNGGTDQERQLDRNKERDDKVETCRMAVGQMAALPALDLEMLRGKRQQGLPLTETQQEVAEQYASVFSIIKTSDVDMVDFLYAVDKGNFGGQDETRSGMTLDDSLKAMYENLKFTSA